MPRFDGTGPDGAGPLTGRGMGPCGDGTPRGQYYGRGYGRRGGFRRGFGRGYGFNRGYAAPVVNEEQYLQERINFLEEELQRLKNIGSEEE